MGVLKPLGGAIDLDGLAAPRHRLSAAADRDRPQLPDRACSTASPWGCGARSALWRGLEPAPERKVADALAAVGLDGFEAGRSARCRAASSSACCSRACCCRTPRSSCSTSRSAPSTPRPSPTCSPDQALARRGPDRDGRAARSRSGARAFPRDAAAGPRARGLGRHARGADAGEPRSRRASWARPGDEQPAICERARRGSARAQPA